MGRRKDFIDSLLDGASRLHRAAGTQTQHQIRELLERGADPNVRNFRGETPLHRAAIRNPDLDVSRTLIGAGADPNAQDEKGATPLHSAAHNPSTGRADLLIEAGADVGARDNSGATPLHHAAESGHAAMIVRLVEAGADPNARDQAGRTPLRIAVEKGWSEGSKTLLNHGADPNVPDNAGQIPLHVAYAAGRQDMVNPLLEAGANLEARDGRAVFRSSTFTIRTAIGGAGSRSKKPGPTTAAKVSGQMGRSLSEFRMRSIPPIQRDGRRCTVPRTIARRTLPKSCSGPGPIRTCETTRGAPHWSWQRPAASVWIPVPGRCSRPAPREGGRTPTGTDTGTGAAPAPQDTHRRVLQAVCRRHHHPDRARHRAVAETLEAR